MSLIVALISFFIVQIVWWTVLYPAISGLNFGLAIWIGIGTGIGIALGLHQLCWRLLLLTEDNLNHPPSFYTAMSDEKAMQQVLSLFSQLKFEGIDLFVHDTRSNNEVSAVEFAPWAFNPDFLFCSPFVLLWARLTFSEPTFGSTTRVLLSIQQVDHEVSQVGVVLSSEASPPIVNIYGTKQRKRLYAEIRNALNGSDTRPAAGRPGSPLNQNNSTAPQPMDARIAPPRRSSPSNAGAAPTPDPVRMEPIPGVAPTSVGEGIVAPVPSVTAPGDAGELFELSQRYAYGNGVPQNPEQAFRLCQQAAEQLWMDAIHMLGVYYYQGFGVEQNIDKAAGLLTYAADRDHIGAAVFLGSMMLRNEVGPTEGRGPFFWLMIGAQAGDPFAQHCIGLMFLNGLDCQQNSKHAYKWLQTAADGGNADAMYQLAMMHRTGEGTYQSNEKAQMYLEMAANHGNEQARAELSASR